METDSDGLLLARWARLHLNCMVTNPWLVRVIRNKKYENVDGPRF
jgi:hypothetical protein